MYIFTGLLERETKSLFIHLIYGTVKTTFKKLKKNKLKMKIKNIQSMTNDKVVKKTKKTNPDQ